MLINRYHLFVLKGAFGLGKLGNGMDFFKCVRSAAIPGHHHAQSLCARILKIFFHPETYIHVRA